VSAVVGLGSTGRPEEPGPDSPVYAAAKSVVVGEVERLRRCFICVRKMSLGADDPGVEGFIRESYTPSDLAVVAAASMELRECDEGSS
jgi:hypothetical protein